MKPFLCFLVMTICIVTTSFGQESNTEYEGVLEHQRISRLDLAKYSFLEEDGTTDVSEFKIRVQGQASIIVKDAKMNKKAIQAIQKAKKESRVIIFDIVRNGVSSKEESILFSIEN